MMKNEMKKIPKPPRAKLCCPTTIFRRYIATQATSGTIKAQIKDGENLCRFTKSSVPQYPTDPRKKCNTMWRQWFPRLHRDHARRYDMVSSAYITLNLGIMEETSKTCLRKSLLERDTQSKILTPYFPLHRQDWISCITW